MADDRLHDELEDGPGAEALSPEELRRARALQEAVDALRAAPAPDLTARVMARLGPAHGPVSAPAAADPAPPAAAPGSLQRLAAWFWRPREVTLRPAYAFGAAMALLAAFLLLPGEGVAPAADAPVATAGDAQLYVQFRIEVPGATEVAVAGTFTGWQPEHALTEVAPGVWSAMVPLAPGVHDYTFIVDGERMVVDPYAPQVADSFGGSNSRLFLPAPSGRA